MSGGGGGPQDWCQNLDDRQGIHNKQTVGKHNQDSASTFGILK